MARRHPRATIAPVRFAREIRSVRLRPALVGAVCASFVLSALMAPASAPTSAADGDAVIASYRERVPPLMAEQGVPGVAVAVVDGQRPLWVEGFGHTDRSRRTPITPETIFSTQSTSKIFTATAILVAVEQGRVALDAPITTYLPDFTVNSIFEQHPERKMTLRMLLAHTAGFTHEAPVGNNTQLEQGTFEEHVASISDTWLRFPVGSGHCYSNLGIDLAGYILQRVYGKPFADVMDELVLQPIGMDDSTFDRDRIRASTSRAIGHSGLFPENRIPLDVAVPAAGGLYASAADLAKFLAFQLGGGTIGGRQVLDSALVAEQRTVPAPYAGAARGYALGVGRDRWRAGHNVDLFSHAGGGYGFLSDFWWVPELQLGVAVLTNSADHQLQGELALAILRDLVNEPGSEYHQRLLDAPIRPAATDPIGRVLAPPGLAELIAAAAMPRTGDEEVRWAALEGRYKLFVWGVIDPTAEPARFVVRDGVPYVVAPAQGIDARLTEMRPGYFLTPDGETVDFSGPTPTWGNMELVRVAGEPAAWQWLMLGLVAAAAVGWLIAAGVRLIRSLARRTPARRVPAHEPGNGRFGRALLLLAGLLTAVAGLGAVAAITAMPGLVDSGFVGWLDLPIHLKAALHLPAVLATATGALIVLLVAAWRRGWYGRAALYVNTALGGAAVALVVQLALWRLIGVGWI